MPGMNEHLGWGALSAGAAFLARKKARNETATLDEVAGQCILGAIGGALPDVFEPADSPRHRKSAHSATGLVLLGVLIQAANENQQMSQVQKDSWTSLGVGYSSHVIADSTTPAGIPLF